MSSKVTQTVEVAAVPFKSISDSIVTLASSLKADGHDQETIRRALDAFQTASSNSASNRIDASVPPPRY